jgi:hypothetical protein
MDEIWQMFAVRWARIFREIPHQNAGQILLEAA